MGSLDFKTSISVVDEERGRVIIRGYSHEEIMDNLPYAEATFLTMVGRLPTRGEARLTDAILTSLLDHGLQACSVSAARYIASGNPQMVPGIAGGLLAAGSNTLSPEHAFRLIDSALARKTESNTVEAVAREVVTEYRSAKKRIPGFGHPFFKEYDFRARILFRIADEEGITGDGSRMYRAIHAEFVKQSGKTDIPINIDGCLACLGFDMGLGPNKVVALALLAVLPGLMTHVAEEIDSKGTLKWIPNGIHEVAEYRPLPPRDGK